MKMQFTFKRGPRTVAVVKGLDDVEERHLPIGKIVDMEQCIEVLTGLRCHIEEQRVETDPVRDLAECERRVIIQSAEAKEFAKNDAVAELKDALDMAAQNEWQGAADACNDALQQFRRAGF